jgi:L-2-hydroxyglutarate oxidase LhgO
MFALQGEIEARGDAIALNSPFARATQNGDTFDVHVGGEAPMVISTRQLVVAAGLGAQACARAIDGFPTERIPRLFYGKGSYFALSGVKAPFARLIYPPPIPGALGTHYRRDLGGVARFGPDLQFIDHEDYAVDPARAAGFYQTIRRFWPALPDGALHPDYAGIRPKLHGPGEHQGDFVIDSEAMPQLVALFGIESPGLTSSLAIGEEVAKRLDKS